MPGKPDTLSTEQARRIALAAQGLATRPSRRKPGTRRLLATIDRLKLLQIDSVNVLIRSHYLPVFSRAGVYPHQHLDRLTFAGKTRTMFEYWAHEASFLPFALHPLLRWRMARARDGDGIYKDLARFACEQAGYVDDVLRHVRVHGPTTVRDLPDPGTRTPDWWSWSSGKMALEYLFWAGDVTTADRKGFERVYDVPERVIPADVLNLPTPGEAGSIRELLRLSAQALGVATEFDLRDYFRLPVAETKLALAELVEAGELTPVEVAGWRHTAYLCKDAELPGRATGTALLSPFDPVVWERDRTERLFGFRYRIEIYTPAPKRIYGYYVLPFLFKGRLAARVCLKADRQAGLLRVNTAHTESGVKDPELTTMLATELRHMSAWLGLETIAVSDTGDLAHALSAELRVA